MMTKCFLHAFFSRVWHNQRGQVGTEYMLVLSVLVVAVVFAFWLLIPGLKEGFVGLARKIISS